MTAFEQGYEDYHQYDNPRQSTNSEYMRGWNAAYEEEIWSFM
jgi:hypothetical protein